MGRDKLGVKYILLIFFTSLVDFWDIYSEFRDKIIFEHQKQHPFLVHPTTFLHLLTSLSHLIALEH